MANRSVVSLAVRVALGLSALVALPAAAAEAAKDDGLDLEEVIVTAQFREQNMQDTPLAVTAISDELLEARSQNNITEITAQVPGVTLKQQSPTFGPSISAYIRGIGTYDFNPSLEPGVGMYVDDVYIATLTGSMIDLLDLDRVEVLRGPQGTLAGRNSIGGSIKLYSQEPRGENSGSFLATYGSRNRVDLRGTANFILADNLYMRISGVDRKQEGYVKRLDYGCANPGNPYGILPVLATTSGCVFGKDSDVNYSAVRAALRWLASDRAEFNFAVDYTSDHRNPTGSILLGYRDDLLSAAARERIQPVLDSNTANNAPGSAFVVPGGSFYNYASFYTPPYNGGGSATAGATPFPWQSSRPVPRQFFDGWGAVLDGEFLITDALKLKSISAYRSYSSGFANDNDLSPLASSIGDGVLPFHSYSQELRLNGDAARYEWTLGLYYLDQRSRYQSWQELRYSAPLMFQQNDVVNASSKAAFAHGGYEITDDLKLTAGLRFTDEHKDYTFVRLNRDGSTGAPIVGPLNGLVGTYNGDRLDYRAALQYDWSENIMTYLQFATGFKGGGISPRPFVADQATPFGRETLENWELGVKADLLESLRVNAAVFSGKYTDIQFPLAVCPGSASAQCGRIDNVGTAKIKGFEVESVYHPVARLSVDASYSYIDFKYTDVTGAGGVKLTDVSPFMPKHKASLGTQYEFGLANGSKVITRADWSFQSYMFTDPNNQTTNRIGGYGLVNTRLTWRNSEGDVDVVLEGTNLTNKYYYFSRVDQTLSRGRHTDASPGRPREWALTIKKKF